MTTELLLAPRGDLSIDQTFQLLGQIKESRVMKDGKKHSHLPQQDVLAHLIRCFGFSGFSYTELDRHLIFEQVRPESQTGTYKVEGQDHSLADNPQKWKYDVAYSASYRLVVFDTEGRITAGPFDDSSTGDAQNQTRADAHDLALKSAISLARKRCAIALGDQFGLALYNKGRTDKIVGGTHVLPDGYKEEMERRKAEAEEGKEQKPDLQDNAPKPESLGVDETAYEAGLSPEETAAKDDAIGHTLGGQRNEEGF